MREIGGFVPRVGGYYNRSVEKVEVQRVGDSLGVIIPPDILERLQVGVGDELIMTTTRSGFELTKVDDVSTRQLEDLTIIMQEDYELLRALAD
jgi:putative addiction module antidote